MLRTDENVELLMTITGSRDSHSSRDPSTRIIACCLYFALPTHIKNALMHTAHARSFSMITKYWWAWLCNDFRSRLMQAAKAANSDSY